MIWILFISIFLFVICFQLATAPFVNPYKLIMIFGKKGSGKSTTMAKLAYQHMERGWSVYSDTPLPGAHVINLKNIGVRSIPPHSVLFVDEAGMVWDNREFKSFQTATRDWFKYQRHYKVKVYLFSQTFDIDKKLRDLTDEMFLVTNKWRIFSYGKRILKKPTLTEAKDDRESRITENLSFDSILFFWAGSRMLTLIPRWANMFDSFATPDLPPMPYRHDDREIVPVPRRDVVLTLLSNVAHTFKLDAAAKFIWSAKKNYEEDIERDIPDIEESFEDFFKNPPKDS